MGRNDLCFCMSGKKTKKCHPDIDEKSLAADKLRIYGKLDQDLKAHQENGTTLCVPGCSDCCHDYFAFQSVEFDLILNELTKWDTEKLKSLIKKIEKYWEMLESEYPEATRILLSGNGNEIEEVNNTIDKTSFPCIFLDETTQLCQIYNSRPFKCRIFGNTFYYPSSEEGAMGIACEKYGKILNDDNFDILLCDVTDLLDKNTDLSIIHDRKRNIDVLNPQYPLIYYLYQHFIVRAT